MVGISNGGSWTSETANYFDFGRIGVIAFFCISGYVIPNSFKGQGIAAARNFALHRFFRLFPAYWFSLPIGAYVIWYAAGSELPTAAWFSNAFMVANFAGHPHGMGHYWTLEIELAFYLATLGLFSLLPKHRFIGSILGFILSYQLWRSGLLKGFSGSTATLGHLLSIMFAASSLRCLSSLQTEPFFRHSKPLRILARAGVCYLAYLLITPFLSAISKTYTLDDPTWARYGWGNFLGILLFAGFLIQRKTPAWLAYLGRCSYSAYLLHSIVFTLLSRFWIKAGLPQTRLEYYILITTALTFAIAALSHRYIELPCIELGKRLAPTPSKAKHGPPEGSRAAHAQRTA